jgi:hypothetical protein
MFDPQWLPVMTTLEDTYLIQRSLFLVYLVLPTRYLRKIFKNTFFFLFCKNWEVFPPNFFFHLKGTVPFICKNGRRLFRFRHRSFVQTGHEMGKSHSIFGMIKYEMNVLMLSYFFLLVLLAWNDSRNHCLKKGKWYLHHRKTWS